MNGSEHQRVSLSWYSSALTVTHTVSPRISLLIQENGTMLAHRRSPVKAIEVGSRPTFFRHWAVSELVH